jgi:hypothetical protein
MIYLLLPSSKLFQMKNLLYLLFALVLLVSGCDYAKKKATEKAMKSLQPKEAPVDIQLDETEKYHAVVEEQMTLAEVADTNKIAESYLKQMLGIPHYVDHPYTILQLSRNYKFTVDELKGIIDGYRDEKAMENKREVKREKGN